MFDVGGVRACECDTVPRGASLADWPVQPYHIQINDSPVVVRQAPTSGAVWCVYDVGSARPARYSVRINTHVSEQEAKHGKKEEEPSTPRTSNTSLYNCPQRPVASGSRAATLYTPRPLDGQAVFQHRTFKRVASHHGSRPTRRIPAAARRPAGATAARACPTVPTDLPTAPPAIGDSFTPHTLIIKTSLVIRICYYLFVYAGTKKIAR